MTSTLKKNKSQGLTFQREAEDEIILAVTKRVKEHNEPLKNNEEKILSYGKIHFSENDCSSWYLRFPFKPTKKEPATPCSNTENSTTTDSLSASDNGNTTAQIPSTSPPSTDASNPTPIESNPTPGIDGNTSATTPASEIVKFMRETWKIPLPQLIISVTGGAKQFKLPSPQLHHAFQKGLVAAVINTDAWVFTGGTHSGVMKEVGDIFEKRAYKNDKAHTRVPVIGITSWSYVADREQLDCSKDISEKPDCSKGTSHKYVKIPLDSTQEVHTKALPKDFKKLYRSQWTTKPNLDSHPLNPNHTHFILLDDCCELRGENCKDYGCSIPVELTLSLRADIEQAARTFDNFGESHRIPIVQILIEGGPFSMQTVYEAIKHKTPVIVIKETGRAADFIAKICDKTALPDDQLKALLTLGVENEIIKEAEKQKYREMFKSEEDRRFITVFSLLESSSEYHLTDTILRAILKAAGPEKEHSTEIRLQKFGFAMMRNKSGTVEKYLSADQKNEPWTETQLDTALSKSIHHDANCFINLLIDRGSSFDRLRRFININTWYQEMKIEEILPLGRDSMNLAITQDSFYQTYLRRNALGTTEASQAKLSSHMSIVYGNTEASKDDAEDFSRRLVFNFADAVRQNGYVSKVTVACAPAPTSIRIKLCVISATKDDNQFRIIRHQTVSKTTPNGSTEIEVDLPNSMLYLETGQFLAVGFETPSVNFRVVPGSASYSVPLEEVNNIYENNQAKEFTKVEKQSVALSFHLVPTQDFIRDIFLWSVFNDRFNQAVCLCSYSPDTITAALVASMIYRKAAKLTHETEEIDDYVHNAESFDRHAAEIIDRCFIQNEEFALQVLTTDSKLYFNYSPLDLAAEGDSRSFLASNSVRAHLDKRWYGELDQRRIRKFYIDFLILILCLCPLFFALPWIYKIFKPSNSEETTPRNKLGRVWRYIHSFRGRAAFRFYYSIIFYILFLGLFSFVILVDYFPLNNNHGKRNGFNLRIPITELILHLCIWSLIVEEIREFIFHCDEKWKRSDGWFDMVYAYFSKTKWNILDLITILVYFVAFTSRFFVIEEAFIVSKVTMCIDLFLWYVRTLHFFAASQRLGPKLLMIFHTMKDLTFFICFVLIFLVGYSVSSYALITTKAQVFWIPTADNTASRAYSLAGNGTALWTWDLWRNVIHWGMWKIYGQVDLIDQNQIGNVTTVTADNDAYGNTAFILTIIFVCVANVLLLNVLVALFNVTFEKVEKDSYRAWAYHRFLLVKEYADKSPLPPPLSMLYYGWELVIWICRFFSRRGNKVIGSSANVGDMDASMDDAVVFNATDIIHCRGTITTITINFCKPPVSEEGKIEVYVIRPVTNHSMQFEISEPRTPTIIHPQKTSAGEQTIKCSLTVEAGTYLGFSFAENAGSPFINSNESYYAKKPASKNGKCSFVHCACQGIAVKFTIKEDARTRRANQQANNAKNVHELLKERLHRPEMFYYRLSEFQKRENMQRVTGISQDYWQVEIKRIVKQEHGHSVHRRNEEMRMKKKLIKSPRYV